MSNIPDTSRPGDNALVTLSDQPGWTPGRQAIFLRALTATHSVAQAARAAGMSRQSAYRLRARLKGEPFDLAWTAALRCRFDALAEAAMDRALHGVEVPHLYKGEVVHTSRRFDERLTVALLLMRDQFGPPRAPSYDPASRYGADDFGELVDRVEQGPATWAEELFAEREALYREGEDEDGDMNEDTNEFMNEYRAEDGDWRE